MINMEWNESWGRTDGELKEKFKKSGLGTDLVGIYLILNNAKVEGPGDEIQMWHIRFNFYIRPIKTMNIRGQLQFVLRLSSKGFDLENFLSKCSAKDHDFLKHCVV